MNRDDAFSPGIHSIPINGIKQRYYIAGEGPLCIVHSGGPGIEWEYLRMPLVEQHLTMLCRADRNRRLRTYVRSP
jgi:hypothetical protein